MYGIAVIALSIWLATILDGVAGQNRDLAQMYQSRLRQIQLTLMAEATERYYLETASFPASIAALAGTSGFEYTKGLQHNWQGYAVSPTLTDSVWQYQRLVLFSNDPTTGVSVATYLATNACGVGGYDTASGWCGSNTSQWYRRETRERFNDEIATQRARLGRVLQKLADYYNVNAKFPDKDNLNVALAGNSITALYTLAGYGGAAAACTGTYTYMTVPIDCVDMFDKWGGTIGYQFVSSKHILLVSETPIYNNSGNRVVVASDLDNSLL